MAVGGLQAGLIPLHPTLPSSPIHTEKRTFFAHSCCVAYFFFVSSSSHLPPFFFPRLHRQCRLSTTAPLH
jgi:hypothetical protein